VREAYEDLWAQLPRDLPPFAFELRRDFLLSRVHPGERVLDVGCGEGAFCAQLAAAGALPLGVEVAEAALERARRRHPDLSFERVEPHGPWPLEDSAFDVVWASEVIEHVADTARWLSEVRRVLRPGGRLLLTTPSHGRLRRTLVALARFEAHFDPVGQHLRFYSRRSLTALLDDFGFEAVRIAAAGGPPLLRETLLADARRARF
jgi:2-polyprenyl-3-methyl-5-hydroxy-6-metoxy-1,4-benzoquinol methylase